jgi:hypothetical protein
MLGLSDENYSILICDTENVVIINTAFRHLLPKFPSPPLFHQTTHSAFFERQQVTSRSLPYFLHEDNPYRTATSLISSTFSLYIQSAERKNEDGVTEFNPSELFLYGTLTAFGFLRNRNQCFGNRRGVTYRHSALCGRKGREEERTAREKNSILYQSSKRD